MDNSNSTHIRSLDGVRGLAIVMVLVHHLFTISYPETMVDRITAFAVRPMWIGVDLFFVLSGFLISRILIKQVKQPNFFKNFYARRSLRIFPLYFSSLVIFLIFIPLLPFNFVAAYGQISTADKLSLFGYLINYRIIEGQSLGHLVHFWSLCVEEHFYLFWPLVVWLCKGRYLYAAMTGIIAVQLTKIMAINMDWPATWYYHATHSRIDALLVGAVTGVIFNEILKPTLRQECIVWILMIVSFATFFYSGYRWNVRGHGIGSLFAMLPLSIMWSCFLLLILWQRLPLNVSKLFEHPVAVTAGKYSYGLYVFHWPILYMTNQALFNRIETPLYHDMGRLPYTFLSALITFIITVVTTAVSWNLIEKRCLSLKSKFQ